MNTKMLATLGLVALLLGGCIVQSIQPLFTDKEMVPCPQLAGDWVQTEDAIETGRWSFVPEEGRYRLTHTDEQHHQATFLVTAGKLGTNIVLDMFPEDTLPKGQVNDLMAAHLIPAHVFAKAVKTNDALMLVLMDLEWLGKHLKANPAAVAHFWRRDGDNEYPILTASSSDLQKFIGQYVNDTNVFKNEVVLLAKSSVASPLKKSEAGRFPQNGRMARRAD